MLALALGGSIDLPQAAAYRRYLAYLPFIFPLFTLAVMIAGIVVGRILPFVYQLAKFALVGGLNFLIDVGVLNLLILTTGIAEGFFASAFKAASFLVAVVSSFLWNKFWTFRSLSVEHAGAEFGQFFVVSVTGLFINVGAFYLWNDVFGPQRGIDARAWASISAAGSSVFGLLWNFAGYKFLVFRKKAEVV